MWVDVWALPKIKHVVVRAEEVMMTQSEFDTVKREAMKPSTCSGQGCPCTRCWNVRFRANAADEARAALNRIYALGDPMSAAIAQGIVDPAYVELSTT